MFMTKEFSDWHSTLYSAPSVHATDSDLSACNIDIHSFMILLLPFLFVYSVYIHLYVAYLHVLASTCICNVR